MTWWDARTMRKRGVVEPAHSRIIHPGDPPEVVGVQHADGSYSTVEIGSVDDEVLVRLQSSSTHHPHLTGM